MILGRKQYAILFIALLMLISVNTANAAGQVVINEVFYDGAEPRSEGDEYIEIKNIGDTPVSLSGYTVTANDGQRFTMAWGNINPGQTCRVYTNRNAGGPCSYNWQSRSARWNNEGDCARLYNSSDQLIDTLCYSGGKDDKTSAQRPNYNAPTTPTTPPSTGGSNGGTPCPASGSWPAGCIPGGNSSGGNGGSNSGGNSGGTPCPASGSWPAGCIPGGNSSGGSGSGNSGGNSGATPCPASGAWPAGCIPGGNSSGGNGSGNSGGNSGGTPCPASGAWPAGCVPRK